MNTAEIVVRIGLLHRRIEEATAKGFRANPEALKMVSELVDLAQALEELGASEFLAKEAA